MQDSERSEVRRRLSFRRATPLRAALRVLLIGVIACVVIVVVSLAVLTPLRLGQQRAQKVAQADLPLQAQNTQLRMTLAAWQLFVEPQLDAIQIPGATLNPADIASGARLAQTQIDQAKVVASALRRNGSTSEARALDTAMAAFGVAITRLNPVAAGADVPAAEFAKVVSDERTTYAAVWSLTSTISQGIFTNSTTPDVQSVARRLTDARRIVEIVGALNLLAALAAAVYFARRTARRQRTERREMQRRFYGTELQEALELATSEVAAYDVADRALREAVPQLDVELLIADSSRAHFHRVFDSHSDSGTSDGCGVVAPQDCPATARGHTMRFPSSEALSACPYLKDRSSGPLSAVCIPVSIAGRSVGVMHARGIDEMLPNGSDIESLELSARRVAERVAMLRTFEKSEIQARTDPLTGLLNRRSLENEVRELHSDGALFALAYGDLDHFKVLNDTNGHEAGDQALRLFSRVMRDSVRPGDFVSRYGGEEFVIVLPDCGAEAAVPVLERVRERLALALASGRVTPFTVSFGVTDSLSADTFDEVVNIADHALLDAKAAGRNRVVVAADATQPGATVDAEPLAAHPGPAPVSTKGR